MTRPTARVLALLEILQAGGTRTVGDLAVRLEVDERTVRRYAAHLVDLDIPVRSVRGRYGGYRLEPGYRMPPLMLTDEEGLAVLLGLIAGRRAGVVSTSAAAAESAAGKVQRSLPTGVARRLETLLQTAAFTGEPRPVSAPGTDVLLLLAEAAHDRRPVHVDHTARNGRRTARTVLPYGIVAHCGRWYVTGADAATGATRTFRLDRIHAAHPLPGTFEIPDGFDPATQVLTSIAETPYRHDVCVRVEGAVADVRSRFPTGIATVTGLEDGWVRVRIRAERLEWVPGVLAGIGLPFVVERPYALRDLVRLLAQRLVAATIVDDITAAADRPRSP